MNQESITRQPDTSDKPNLSDPAKVESPNPVVQTPSQAPTSKKKWLIIAGLLIIAGIINIIMVINRLNTKPVSEELIAILTQTPSVSIEPNTTTKLAVIPNKFTNIDSITFSRDGRKVAYRVKVDGKFIVVLNGEEGKQYDMITDIVFSPNGEKLAYLASLDKKTFVVLDNEEGTRYVDIRNIAFSPDSKLIAYAIYDFSNGLAMSLVIGDQEFKNFGGSGSGFWENFTFSQDGKKVAWVTSVETPAHANSGFYITTLDLESKTTSKLDKNVYNDILQLISSPNGQKIAYLASKNDKDYLVINGTEQELTNNIHGILPINYSGILLPNYSDLNIFFSPDSQKLAYVTYDTTGKNYLIVGDQILETHDFYGLETPLVFSPDGKRTAFGVRYRLAGGNYMIIDNQKMKVYEGGISSSVFSPDSQKVAYLAEENNKNYIVVNEKEIEISEIIYTLPIFSGDSKMIGYGAKIGNELWWILKPIE